MTSETSQRSTRQPAPGLGDMTARTRWHGDILVIHAAGEIDVLTAPQLAGSIATALSERSAALIVDLTEVTFLGSAGLGLLIGAKEQAADRRFGIVTSTPVVRRSLEATGLTDVLAVFPTLREALDAH